MSSQNITLARIYDLIGWEYKLTKGVSNQRQFLKEDKFKNKTVCLVFGPANETELQFVKDNIKKLKILFESKKCVNKNHYGLRYGTHYPKEGRNTVLVLDWIGDD